MTLEEIAKALPTLDAGTLEELRRNDASFKAIEDRLNAEISAQWKLAILRQMKEVNHDN